MSTVHEQLEDLGKICRDLGGRFLILPQAEFDDAVDADEDICGPGTAGSRFEYAIHWKKKILYAMRGTTHIGFIIHEAGHVFADRHDPDDDACDEWAWLGWEIAVARRLGAWAAWSRQNASYHLGEGTRTGVGADKDWRDLSASERRAIVADRVAHAKKIGVLSPSGVPRSLR